MSQQAALFTPLLVASVVFFSWSLYRRLSLVGLGKPESGKIDFASSIKNMLVYAIGQRRVLRQPFGFNHFIFFWACIFLIFVNVEFMLEGIFPAINLAGLPAPIYFSICLVSDILSSLAALAVVIAVIRRVFFPPYPQARTLEAFFLLAVIGIHMLAYLGICATEIALGEESAAAYMPVASQLAGFMGGMTANGLASLHTFFWWTHAIALMIFLNLLIPYSKHLHVFTAIANCFLRHEEKPSIQPLEEFVPGNVFGTGQVDRFSRKDLFDSFACTKCGRCQMVCPAGNTGKQLNPRAVINDIKVNLLKNGPLLKQGHKAVMPLIGDTGEGSVPEEALWDCTTCGACMEACPVFIKQMPKLLLMRRHMVEEEAKFPEELLNLFENMESRSNPWGIAPSERTKWCSQLSVKPFEQGVTEYLLFVGCAGSFDSRNKHVTVALATLLDNAGISWGILGKEEKCCGDSLRRLGNEFVFDRLARENVAIFKEKGVKKIITQCPHCFSTLKNDYRQYGLEVEVVHHSELLRDLVQAGRIKLQHQATELGRTVFHDSCYLGRHNDVYDAPRALIASATGAIPAEMERNRENAFCCGAGGGRMWLEETEGERINHNRVREALTKSPDTICVSCPYCMTMFEDGLKDVKAEGVRIRDVAEVLAEAALH